MQPHAPLSGQPGALPQQGLRHGEGGAGRQRKRPHGAEARVMPFRDGLVAVPQDLVHGLDHGIRGQSPVLFAEIHAAPAGGKADAQGLRRGELGPQQIPAAPGEDIVVVEAGGAAVLHQLPHPGEGGEPHQLRVQVLPDFVEGPEPVEELQILDRRQIPGELLIQVVVGVDEPRIAEHLRAVQHLVGLLGQPLADGGDHPVLRQQVDPLVHPVVLVAAHQPADALQKNGSHILRLPVSAEALRQFFHLPLYHSFPFLTRQDPPPTRRR